MYNTANSVFKFGLYAYFTFSCFLYVIAFFFLLSLMEVSFRKQIKYIYYDERCKKSETGLSEQKQMCPFKD